VWFLFVHSILENIRKPPGFLGGQRCEPVNAEVAGVGMPGLVWREMLSVGVLSP
jgi:hypothetical protein